ncbi:M1 family metallopeptidase [bacterium]|nr:M1 family metallopeptidase [bacterium]
MKIQRFFLPLFLLLILGSACAPQAEQIAPSATSMPAPTETTAPSPTPLPMDLENLTFLSEHPWDDPTVFDQMLAIATNNPQDNALPGASQYHLVLNIPTDLTTPLTGKLAVRYTNQEDTDLAEILFRLFPNYYGGTLTPENVLVNDQPATTEIESASTVLRVILSDPLAPGEQVTINMDFILELPATMGGNYGLLGYFDNILVLDTFYPMIPAYDEAGWYSHYPYPNGDLTYQDASYYLVDVIAPQSFVLAASGSQISSEIAGDQQHTVFAAGPARDFYLAGSDDFTVISTEVEGIQVNSYALTGSRPNQEYALNATANALQTFGEIFGPYPYTEFDVISSPMQALGIEYPGITGIFLGLYETNGSSYGMANTDLMDNVIVHEVGHQWFYNLVGNDQQGQPWVDEAVTQYVTYLYYFTRDQIDVAYGLVANWQGRLSNVEEPQLAIGLSADQYSGVDYSGIVYGRGPLFFYSLEDQIGQDTVIAALQQYAQDYRWGLADTQSLQTELENACNCDLSTEFQEWIFPGLKTIH